jgi:hypothetical protein
MLTSAQQRCAVGGAQGRNMSKIAIVSATLALFYSSVVFAQDAPIVGAAPSASSSAVAMTVPVGTIIEVQIVDTMSSKIAKQGETFALRLAKPIQVGGQILIPAGALGAGEVIDSQKGGFGGAAGKLVLSARYIEVNGARMPIRAMRIGVAGDDYVKTAITIGFISPISSLFVTGGNVEVPAGTVAGAKVAADFVVPPASPSVPTATIAQAAPPEAAPPEVPLNTSKVSKGEIEQ